MTVGVGCVWLTGVGPLNVVRSKRKENFIMAAKTGKQGSVATGADKATKSGHTGNKRSATDVNPGSKKTGGKSMTGEHTGSQTGGQTGSRSPGQAGKSGGGGR